MKYVVLPFLFLGTVAFASDSQSELLARLHAASSDISQHVDAGAVTKSLYRQMRPRVLITSDELDPSQIDRRVEEYISGKYSPVLIENYSRLYSTMRKGGKEFSRCDKPEDFRSSEEVKMTLCVVEERDSVRVNYMTNGYGRGWTLASAFIFSTGNEIKLVAIDLGLREDQRVRVEGI